MSYCVRKLGRFNTLKNPISNLFRRTMVQYHNLHLNAKYETTFSEQVNQFSNRKSDKLLSMAANKGISSFICNERFKSTCVTTSENHFDNFFNDGPEYYCSLLKSTIYTTAFNRYNCFEKLVVYLLILVIVNGNTVHAKDSDGNDNCNGGDDTTNTFSPVTIEEVSVSDPVELNEAASLTHTHLVRQSAGVAAEAALQLTLRACRALLAVTGTYRKSLLHVLDLMDYHLLMVGQSTAGVGYEDLEGQLTEAAVAGNADLANCRKQFMDSQLLVRVSAQNLENACLCCHLSGTEATAMAATAALAALRAEVEKHEREIRQLQSELLMKQAEVIKMEQLPQDEEKQYSGEDEHDADEADDRQNINENKKEENEVQRLDDKVSD